MQIVTALEQGHDTPVAVPLGNLAQLLRHPGVIGFDQLHHCQIVIAMRVEADYTWVTQQLRAVAERHCNGRIVSLLEGGYNLHALGRSATAHIKVLAGL